jgi:hypothetical protein
MTWSMWIAAAVLAICLGGLVVCFWDLLGFGHPGFFHPGFGRFGFADARLGGGFRDGRR